MVSAATLLSLLRRHGSHSPGQLFSLSIVEAEDGWSRFSLFKASQLIQQWWLPCNFWMAQSPCRLLDENNFQFGRMVEYMFGGFVSHHQTPAWVNIMSKFQLYSLNKGDSEITIEGQAQGCEAFKYLSSESWSC